MNISEHIVDRLRRWGVHRVYGYPGDGIGGVLVAVSATSRSWPSSARRR